MEKKNNSMLACRMVCCSHRSDRRIWVCTSHLSDCRIRVCISHRSDYASIIGHPLGGGTPGKFNVEWGLIREFERLTYPGGGGNEGGLFSKSLAPRGKQDRQTKQVNFKLS